MKSKYFLIIEDGKITSTTDCSNEREPNENEVAVSLGELQIARMVHGDLEYAKHIIDLIENRIKSLA